jgi:hypothetical protein
MIFIDCGPNTSVKTQVMLANLSFKKGNLFEAKYPEHIYKHKHRRWDVRKLSSVYMCHHSLNSQKLVNLAPNPWNVFFTAICSNCWNTKSWI